MATGIIPVFPGTAFEEVTSKGILGREPGITPKYSRLKGEREPDFRETMARLYVPFADPQARKRFLDAVPPETKDLAEALTGSGYIDFQISAASHTLSEKVDVTETLADNYVSYFFGEAAPSFSYQGFLVNSVQDEQVHKMLTLYRDVLRGTQLARRRTVASLRYDGMIVTGAFLNLNWTLMAENEVNVPFSFNLLVKRLVLLPPASPSGATRLSDEFADGSTVLALLPGGQDSARVVRSLRSVAGKAPPAAERAAPAPTTPASEGFTPPKPTRETLADQGVPPDVARTASTNFRLHPGKI